MNQIVRSLEQEFEEDIEPGDIIQSYWVSYSSKPQDPHFIALQVTAKLFNRV